MHIPKNVFLITTIPHHLASISVGAFRLSFIYRVPFARLG